MKSNRMFMLSVMMAVSFLLVVSQAIAAEKIGFVNFREIVTSSDAGKKFFEGLKKTFDKDRALMKGKEDELKKLQAELEKQRSVMKPEVLREKETAFQKKLRDAQVMAKDFEEEIMKKEQEFVGKIQPDIVKIVIAIGEKERYTMIIDPFISNVLYRTNENDLTKRVVAEFNRAYKNK